MGILDHMNDHDDILRPHPHLEPRTPHIEEHGPYDMGGYDLVIKSMKDLLDECTRHDHDYHYKTNPQVMSDARQVIEALEQNNT